jgi:hypothetical protein
MPILHPFDLLASLALTRHATYLVKVSQKVYGDVMKVSQKVYGDVRHAAYFLVSAASAQNAATVRMLLKISVLQSPA